MHELQDIQSMKDRQDDFLSSTFVHVDPRPIVMSRRLLKKLHRKVGTKALKKFQQDTGLMLVPTDNWNTVARRLREQRRPGPWKIARR